VIRLEEIMDGRSIVPALAIAVMAAMPATAAEILVLSGGAAQSPLGAALPAFEARSGHKVNIAFAPAGEIARRVGAGEVFDLLVLPDENVEGYEKQGKAVPGSRAPLGKVGIGVAVNARAPSPDIATPEAFKQALLAAKSIVYIDPARGTSGKHFAGVLQQLGIADVVNAKAKLGSGGYVVAPVGTGEIELGVHQITEILPVPGVKLVGPLPEALQKWTTYTAVAMPGSKSPEAARALVAYLTSAEARALFAPKGFSAP
jgi:molybdate transport system substrate-binding protein